MGRKRIRKILLPLVAGMLLLSSCGTDKQDTPSDELISTLSPAVTSVPGNAGVSDKEGTVENSGVDDEPVRSEITVLPAPTPTPVVIIPDDIVDTSKEPYTYSQLCKDLELLSIAYPDIISVSWDGVSADGRAIPAVLFGNPEAERAVFVQAAIHGREHLTSLLVMEQLEHYAKGYDTCEFQGVSYRDIFSNVSLLVVPMSNPDGVSVSQLGTGAIRSEKLRALVESFYERDGAGVTREYFYRRYKANANGVDLNRNFAYGWEEYGGAAGPAADRYKGQTPGSEPETRYLMELTKSRNTAVSLSYHATGSVLYWDFGQTGEIRERCLEVVNTVHDLTGYRIVYASSDKQDEAGYCEWAVGIEGIPEVTIETGTVAAPLPISEFAGIWEKNKEVPVAVALQVMQGAKQ